MTIEIGPEDEKLIQEKLQSGAFRSVDEIIHRALVSLPTESSSPKPKKSLYQVMRESPLVGLDITFERQKDYSRPVDL